MGVSLPDEGQGEGERAGLEPRLSKKVLLKGHNNSINFVPQVFIV